MLLPKLVWQPRDAPLAMPAERTAIITNPPDGTPVAFGARTGNELWVSVPRRATFQFEPGCSVVDVHPDPDADDERVLDAYHGAALPMVAQAALEQQVLHASAVVTPSPAVVAFCGSTHAGKTTLAYGLGRRGYSIWADDVLAFDAAKTNAVLALRLPFRLNLREQVAARFGARGRGSLVRRQRVRGGDTGAVGRGVRAQALGGRTDLEPARGSPPIPRGGVDRPPGPFVPLPAGDER